MKKILIYTIGIFCVLIITSTVTAYSYWGDKTMSANEVKKMWGSENIDIKKFKNSPYEVKAKMAYSIMTDKSLIGKSYKEIRELFGPNDGYYITETMPAYIVFDGSKTSKDTWQLVFRMNREFKVNDIIMHKNCCEK